MTFYSYSGGKGNIYAGECSTIKGKEGTTLGSKEQKRLNQKKNLSWIIKILQVEKTDQFTSFIFRFLDSLFRLPEDALGLSWAVRQMQEAGPPHTHL